MDGALTLILFFFIIGILVFVHEFGHFAAAKLTGVPVNEFAIGFGPILFEKKYGATRYQFRLIPLGGFVSLEGEEDANSPEGFRNQRYLVKVAILLGGIFMNIVFAILILFVYLNVTDWKMLLPTLSNHSFSNTDVVEDYHPIGVYDISELDYGWENLEPGEAIIEIEGQKVETSQDVVGLIKDRYGEEVRVTVLDTQKPEVFEKEITIGGLYEGKYLPLIVSSILEDSEVRDNFKEGEIVVTVDDVAFKSFDEFQTLLEDNQGQLVRFGFQKPDNDEITYREIEIPMKNEETGAILGISFFVDYGIFFDEILDLTDNTFTYFEFNRSIITPTTLSYDLVVYQIDGLASLVSDAFSSGDFSEVGQSVGSPVAVGASVNQIVVVGNFTFLLFLAGLISLSLAMFNILPIPALDGGQVALVTVEKLRGQKFSEDTIQKINASGFIFLMGLSVLLIAKDIAQFGVIGDIFDTFQGILGR